MSKGWSDDFSKAPTDTLLWVYATDDQGYAYGQAVIWKRGNPGEPKLLWSQPHRPIDDGVEKPLMWHRMPKDPSLDVLDAVCLAKAPNTSAAKHIGRLRGHK